MCHEDHIFRGHNTIPSPTILSLGTYGRIQWELQQVDFCIRFLLYKGVKFSNPFLFFSDFFYLKCFSLPSFGYRLLINCLRCLHWHRFVLVIIFTCTVLATIFSGTRHCTSMRSKTESTIIVASLIDCPLSVEVLSVGCIYMDVSLLSVVKK